MPQVREVTTRAQNLRCSPPVPGKMHVNRRARYLAWMGCLLLWPCLVLGQPSYDLDAAASDVSGQLARLFPHLQGEVVEIQDEQLYLGLGARDQVFENMQLQVFREGEELTSPGTGEVLGRLEEDLGVVRVIQVAETYSVAVPTKAPVSAVVKVGDKVRITAGRLPLVLLPVSDPVASEMPLSALLDALQNGLDATGRFYLVPRARLTLWLLERELSPGDVLSPGVMSEAADALGVAYLVQPVLRYADDTAIVELRLLAPDRPQTPVTTALAVLSEANPASRGRTAQPAVAVAAAPVRPEPTEAVTDLTPARRAESPATLHNLLHGDPVSLEEGYLPIAEFASELRGFDAADVDGDGRTELVLLNETKVSLYRLNENRLDPVASYSDRRPGTFLSAQLLHLPESQVLAVVVNRYSSSRGGMDSLLLLLQGTQLIRQQKGLPDILLAVDTDGDGVNETIWGQRFDRDDFFRRGQVRQYEFRNERLKRQRKLVLPARFRATGTALARLGPQSDRQLVFVDDRHRLQVYDGGTRRWTSPGNMGGSYVSATLQNIRGGGNVEQKQFDFEAIPAVADLDGDGIDEVLLPQNQARFGAVPNLNLYSGGHVVAMRQTPQGFALSTVSPGFDGVVSGVAVLKGSEPGILVAVSKWEGVLRQRKQTILYLNRL